MLKHSCFFLTLIFPLDLIDYNERYEAAFLRIFGNAVLVSDMAVGEQIAQRSQLNVFTHDGQQIRKVYAYMRSLSFISDTYNREVCAAASMATEPIY